MITESQIREKLIEFLDSKIDLDSFEDWLVTQSWNMHRDSDEAVQRLVSGIELRLAEFSAGHLSERVLRDEFRELLPRNAGISIVRIDPQSGAFSGSSVHVETPFMPLRPFALAGIRFVAESV